MEVIRYTILGDPRTKKNHQRIAGQGIRCALCGKFKREFIVQSAAHDAFEKSAARQLFPRPQTPICCPVNVRCIFWMATSRKVDKSNLEATIHDLLVETGILADDSRDILAGTDGSRVYYDKANPRVEITITKMADYEQWKNLTAEQLRLEDCTETEDEPIDLV